MLSKSLLEWSKQVATKSDASSDAKPDSGVVLADAHSDRPNNPKPSNPMNAQARAPSDVDSFDARWRSRVERAILEEMGGSADKPRRPAGRRL